MSLVASGLVLTDGGRCLLDGVSVVAAAGSMLAVTGPSGSGKTTLLHVLGGLLVPDSGEVSCPDRPASPEAGVPRAGTALVLQNFGLVPFLTAEENVVVALRALDVAAPDAVRRAAAALDRVGVGDLGERLVQELSGGQEQRVAVARGLVVEPDVLLADEPTSELDVSTRDAVMAELRAEADRGAVVVVATHDPEVAAMCDDEIHLDQGAVTTRPDPLLTPSGDDSGDPHEAFRRAR